MNKMKSLYSIMTFNIHNFMNYEMKDCLSDIQSLIQSYDIIALQEVYDTKKLHIILGRALEEWVWGVNVSPSL